ncbi:hypothetical protein CCACVL1_05303 [Corchorus capsularis]|uniref:Uncharacterized protein n=1 Tax=Corchorus capsularis TaxID=210143 RepID=A0A1R3JLC7_COCAP|nr:hypothetical protein CCACVL1_05303 [Corchorus capsularis]
MDTIATSSRYGSLKPRAVSCVDCKGPSVQGNDDENKMTSRKEKDPHVSRRVMRIKSWREQHVMDTRLDRRGIGDRFWIGWPIDLVPRRPQLARCSFLTNSP